ncbi:MAG: hypothetical protein R3E31_02100 [Chloroflexota bacterium]
MFALLYELLDELINYRFPILQKRKPKHSPCRRAPSVNEEIEHASCATLPLSGAMSSPYAILRRQWEVFDASGAQMGLSMTI